MTHRRSRTDRPTRSGFQVPAAPCLPIARSSSGEARYPEALAGSNSSRLRPFGQQVKETSFNLLKLRFNAYIRHAKVGFQHTVAGPQLRVLKDFDLCS